MSLYLESPQTAVVERTTYSWNVEMAFTADYVALVIPSRSHEPYDLESHALTGR